MTLSTNYTSRISALKELATQVRECTLQLLHIPEPDWLTWSPPSTSNHILWHGGHALWVQDVLCVMPLTGRSELPALWEESFGQHCRPVATTSTWPDESEVRALLVAQLDAIRLLLDEHAETIAINADERPPGRRLAALGRHDSRLAR